VYEFINTSAKHKNAETGLESFLKRSFVVGAVGQAIWRKGVDLFLQLASVIKTSYPGADIKFVWVGDTGIDAGFEGKLSFELKQYGLDDTVIFTGLSSNTFAFYTRFDVLALTSREDPFPLVCLEAASLFTPIICFEKTGGMPEFIEGGNAGKTVEYANVRQMAKEILELYENEDMKKTYAANARAYVQNFSIEKGSAHLYQIIQQYL
jgi:glycosyltransferase involved in cell wall biosynthesis